MMMKGPFRELISVDAEVNISIPAGKKAAAVHLLISRKKPGYEMKGAKLHVKVPQVKDHEIIGVEFV